MFTDARAPLRSRPFRIVWSGETLSMLGDRSFDVAFIWLIFEVTGSAGTLAAVLLVQAIPRGVLLLVGGAVSDRLSPRTVMTASHLTRGVAVAGLGVLAFTGSVELWHLFGLGVVIGVAEAFFWPANASILPSLLPKEHLARGNALTGFGEQVTWLVGPILGGVLVATVGSSPALLFNSVTFFIAALTLLAAPRTKSAHTSTRVKAIAADIWVGLRYAYRSREVRIVLLLIAAATLSYSGLFAVGLPALAKTFDNGSIALGVLLSAWGLGQLIGTVAAVFTGLPRRWGLLIIGMTLCEGTAFVLLGLLPSVWSAAAVLTLLGIGVAYSMDVALPTFIQTKTAPEILGRVSSVMDLPRVVLEPVSLAVMGLLVTGDLRVAFAVAAVPVLAVGIRLVLSSRARALSTEDSNVDGSVDTDGARMPDRTPA